MLLYIVPFETQAFIGKKKPEPVRIRASFGVLDGAAGWCRAKSPKLRAEGLIPSGSTLLPRQRRQAVTICREGVLRPLGFVVPSSDGGVARDLAATFGR